MGSSRALPVNPPRHVQRPMVNTEPDPPDIITVTYGDYFERPEIKLLDAHNRTTWSWRFDDTRQPGDGYLEHCLLNGADAPEVKWAADGTKVATVLANAVLVINHTPHDPENDKKIVFGVCRDGNMLGPSHTLEPLPDGKLAIATSGQTPEDGIWIFDTSEGLVRNPHAVQKVAGLRAIHAMVWDEQEQLLWAAGNNLAADGRDGESYGLVNAYRFDRDTGRLGETPSRSHLMPSTRQCNVEFGEDTFDGSFWDGPHDLVPIPSQRKFLLSTDLDIHTFDIDSGKFDCCDSVADTYLRGFKSVGHRTGINRAGEVEEQPRSDLKSLSVSPDGRRVLYNQARWTTYTGRYINHLVDGKKAPNIDPGEGGVYRARWFDRVPGWPGAWETKHPHPPPPPPPHRPPPPPELN